jgi:hypothetical protein
MRQVPGEPGLAAVLAGRNIIRRTNEQAYDVLAKKTLNFIKNEAKTTGLSKEEIGKQLVAAIENNRAVANQLVGRAQVELHKAYKKSGFLDEAKLLKEGRTIELDQLRKLRAAIPDEIADPLVKEGILTRSVEELVGRELKKFDDLVIRADAMNARLAEIGQPIKDFSQKYINFNEEQLMNEIIGGVSIKGLPISRNALGYIYHRITPEGAAALQDATYINKFRTFVSANIAPAKQRHLKGTIEEVNKWAVEEGILKPGQKFFTDDPLRSMRIRQWFSKRGSALAYEVRAVADIFATPKAGGESLAHFLNRARVTGYRGAKFNFTKKHLKKLAKDEKFSLRKARLKEIELKLEEHGYGGLNIPHDIAKDARLTINTLTKDTPEWREFNKLWDQIMVPYRALVTLPIPIYHMRNLLGNVYNGAWLGKAKDVRDWKRGFEIAIKFHVGKFLSPADQKIVDEAMRLGVIGRSGLTYEIRSMMNLAQSGAVLEKIPLFGPALRESKKLLTHIGEANEDAARLAVYLNQKKKGKSMWEAAAHVRKYLFDYENGLTMFEKKYPRRLSFFYTFTRFNTPLQLEYLRPDKIYKHMIIARTLGYHERSVKDELPQFLERIDTIPSEILGLGPGYINLGLPFSDEILVSGRRDISNLRTLPRAMMNMLAPPLQSIAELALGKETFLGADINELDKAGVVGWALEKVAPDWAKDWLKIKKRPDGSVRMHPQWAHVIRSLPPMRFQMLLDRLVDVRFTPEERLKNFIAAAVLGTPFSKDRARLLKIREDLRVARTKTLLEGR